MHPQDFKVFIASSLSLTQDRQEVEDAINEINQDILKDSFLHFSIFDYVKEEKIVQKLELGDAQEPIRRFLYESLVFVLIIRGRVGNLTVSEFEDAITRFREGRLPQYIFMMKITAAIQLMMRRAFLSRSSKAVIWRNTSWIQRAVS